VDQEQSSMFPSGSSGMSDRTRRLMQQVAQAVAKLPNKLAISGYTDAQPFRGAGNYSNWELSTDRANASRRALIEAGVPADRIRQVTGNADQDPLIKDNPLDARNRRIAIMVLSDAKLANTGNAGGGAGSGPGAGSGGNPGSRSLPSRGLAPTPPPPPPPGLSGPTRTSAPADGIRITPAR